MAWVKRGPILRPQGQRDWLTTRAMLPTAMPLSGDRFRIYFSGGDDKNQSRIGYIEVDINEPEKILKLIDEPVLDIGAPGCFDDSGVSPTWLMNYGGKIYLYYMGWNKGSAVRVSEVSGLAFSDDGGESFVRHSQVPVIDRTAAEPFLILVISCVLIAPNGTWRMWYDSADAWITPELPKYNIKYAESLDGINWHRRGVISVDYASPAESRISRACVLHENGLQKMWYCSAIGKNGYQMGYAEGPARADGLGFIRKDGQVGINLSESGWDSEMICYPNVFDHKGKRYMLYCGNGYGRGGFGYAVWEDDHSK
jgi:hypothetical protein